MAEKQRNDVNHGDTKVHKRRTMLWEVGISNLGERGVWELAFDVNIFLIVRFMEHVCFVGHVCVTYHMYFLYLEIRGTTGCRRGC